MVVERDRRQLPRARLEHQASDAEPSCFRLERIQKMASDAAPALLRNHEHALQLSRLGQVEPTQRAAGDCPFVSPADHERTASLGDFFDIEAKMRGARLGVHAGELRVQRDDERPCSRGLNVGATDDSVPHAVSR